LLLAACGESGERQALEEMIHASMVETGPESCLKFSTLRMLESTTDREGEAAITACEESSLDSFPEQPKGADVSQVDVDGDSATALLAFKGSFLDGQRLRYAFVERGGRWRYDQMLGFVDLDAARLILRMGREGLLQADTPQEAEDISCWIGQMERMSDEELEELLFEDRDVSSDCTAKSNAI